MHNLFPPLNIIMEGKRLPPNQMRSEIKPGLAVYIVEKHNQRSGILTKGIVKTILTSKPTHTRGIKVRLVTGQVGRVHCIIGRQVCKSNAKL
jgi:uncharacterized repeat protein (TIGR03833 family)